MSKSLKYGSHDFPASAGFTHSCHGGRVKVQGYERGGRVHHVDPPKVGRGSGEAVSKGLTGSGPTGEAVKTQPKAKTSMPHASANVDPPPRATYGRLADNAPTGALAKAGGRTPLLPGYSRGRRVG